MSIEKTATELRQAFAALDVTPAVQALELIDQANRLVAAATRGSQRPEAGQALALLDHARQQLGQVYRLVEHARQLIQQYLADIAEGEAPPKPVPRARTVASQDRAANHPTIKPTSSATTPAKFDRDQADAIRATLPPQVPTPNPTGKKTHGKWFDGRGGETSIVSGYDEDAAEAWRLLQAAGMPPAREPATTAHVEMKAVVRARRTKATHTQVVLNNVPCRGIYGCDQLLPILLPEGYTLTVHGPNYRKTFTGGQKWSN